MALAWSYSVGAAAEFAWKKDVDSASLRHKDQIVWQFNFGTNDAKPSFHPVAAVGGPVITWYRPGDHKWHRGLWFSWKFLNGINYWEEDVTTGKAAGATVAGQPDLDLRSDFSARIKIPVAYRSGGKTVLSEQRLVEISKPSLDGGYYMDWDMTFTAGNEDVKLDRTPLPHEPEGKVYGGYAGLSLRFAKPLTNVNVLTATVPVSFKDNRFRGKSPGMEYDGQIEGTDVGAAILDHPENVNAPTPWYAINDPVMHFFTPAVLCYGPLTLKAGETMRLRYRVHIHTGRWDADTLKAKLKNYSGS